MADNRLSTSPDMALCVAVYIDPKWYHYIVSRNGHRFITDPNAKRAWECIDPETGAFDEIQLFQGDPVVYDAFQKGTASVQIIREYNLDNWIRHCRKRWQVDSLTEAMKGLEQLSPEDQISVVNSAILEIHSASTVASGAQDVEKALEDIDRVSSGERPENAFGWPIPWMLEFNDLHKHEFVVVGGRPGTGKSAFMGQLAYEYAKQGKRVCYISLEMTPVELFHRWTALEVGFGMKRIAHDSGRSVRYKEAFKRVAGMDNLRVCCKSTLAEILAEINTEKVRGVDIIFIDYLQLINTTGRSRLEELSAITRSLKRAAMDGVPVVVGSQLNREGDGEKPKLSHLRESGSIEQDADRVFLLHNDQQASYIIQAKLRNGPRWSIKTAFEGETFSFNAQSRWENAV